MSYREVESMLKMTRHGIEHEKLQWSTFAVLKSKKKTIHYWAKKQRNYAIFTYLIAFNLFFFFPLLCCCAHACMFCTQQMYTGNCIADVSARSKVLTHLARDLARRCHQAWSPSFPYHDNHKKKTERYYILGLILTQQDTLMSLHLDVARLNSLIFDQLAGKLHVQRPTI